MDLSSLATHAQRLSARLSENLAERSKDLGLDPEYNLANPSSSLTNKLPIFAHAQGLLANSIRLWDRLPEISSPTGEIETKRLLSSKSEPDRVEGLKRVILMMSRNRPVLSFFPFVTNCLHSPSSNLGQSNHPSRSDAFAIRHLVSIYLLNHSYLAPDLALLSVNAWQKDLVDPSPIIRSLALRTLAGMGLESVLPLVVITIEKLVNDPNWLVKRTVAEAVITVHNMDSETYNSKLIDGPLKRLLQDRSPLVVGVALLSWESICPNRWDLLHKNFRFYCWVLADLEENGQHILIRVLTRYIRQHFTNPNLSTDVVDPDLDKFLNSLSALFKSRSTPIIIAATNAFIYLAPQNRLLTFVPDLIRLVEENSAQGQDESLLIILRHIYHIIQFTSKTLQAHLFLEYFQNFMIFSASDSQAVKMAKLEILTSFVSHDPNSQISSTLLSELKFYSYDSDLKFVRQVIRTIGEVAILANDQARQEALNLLIELLKSNQSTKVCESIKVLRFLLSSHLDASIALLPKLDSLMADLTHLIQSDKLKQDSTRANLYWLIAQVNFGARELNHQYPNFFKYALSRFVVEGMRSKLQILSLVSKTLLLTTIRQQEAESPSSVLFGQRRVYLLGFEHIMRLARYDTNFSIRDRARYLQGLFMSTHGLMVDQTASKMVEVFKNETHQEGLTLLSEEAAFAQGHQIVPSQNPLLQLPDAPNKIELKELNKILFLSTLPQVTRFQLLAGLKGYEPNSLFSMIGLATDADDDVSGSLSWAHLAWKTIPPWTTMPLDSSSRDPEEEYNVEILNGLSQSRINQPVLYNSSELTRQSLPKSAADTPSYQQHKQREKVVLIPTDEDSQGFQTTNNTQTGGYRNLEDFLQSSSEEDSNDDDEDEDEDEDEDNETDSRSEN
ncbi:hypothetical protein O181_000177 [Austropuccinia psidii MF-1]|uniref:Clathrin/coatomer adaptor adaptin-like N-terminal domain-containing protein n=1 Tax=Austropuccinia psidii MF-1 TaxID=1389203 RepID=A0A9Q3B874_9BASI|nr:hypothetical protein [Austropuccinia psidii MF-1]